MEAAELLIKLMDTIASPSAADVFKAIYQDPLIVKLLEDEPTLQRVCDGCGSDPTQWIPANICLVASEFPISMDELKAMPLQPLDPELRQQVSALYQQVLLNGYQPVNAHEALLVALAMRERRRLTDSWNGLAREVTRNFSQGFIKANDWKTPLAVLYGITLDTDSLLIELGQLKQCLPDSEFVGLLLHILLSGHYETDDDLFEDVFQMVDVLSIQGRAEALAWLERHGFSALGLRVAQNLSADPIISKELISKPDDDKDPLEHTDVFERLSSLHKQNTLVEYQNNQAIKDAILQEEERLLNQASAIIQSARLPGNLTGQYAADWQKISDLVPDSDLAKAELAFQWIFSGEPGKAEQIKLGNSSHPFVLAFKAYLAAHQGNLGEADLILDNLVKSLGESPIISRNKVHQIIHLINQIELSDKVEQVLKSLPYGMAAQDQVMGLLARQNFKNGQFAKAKKYAQATLLLNEQDIDVKRLLAHAYENEQDYASAMQIWDTLTSQNDQADPGDLHSLAACSIRSNSPQKAIETCKSLIEKSPSDGEAYILLGDAYQQIGDYPQALESYEKAITSSPEMESAWMKLVQFHVARNESDQAFSALSTGIKAVPNSALLHYTLGCQLAEKDSIAESSQQFQIAHTLQPKNLDYIKALGKSLSQCGRWHEAEEVYRKALQLNPFDANLLHAYGLSLLRQNLKTEAVVPYQKLIELHPTDIEIYIEFSSLVVEDLTGGLSNVPESPEQIDLLQFNREALENALDRMRTNWILQLFLAETLLKLNELDASREYFTLLSEHIYELPLEYHWRVNYGLGLTSGENGQVEVALAALQEAANQNPQNYQIHQQLAEAYYRANLGQSAIQAAQQALSINPRDTANLIWYADFCTRSNELPEALSTLDALLKMQPENIELRIKLGALQLKTGLIDQAIESFKALVINHPLTPAQYQQIASLLAEADEYAEAIRILKIGIQNQPVEALPLLLDLVQYEQQSGDISSALATIEQALTLDAENIKLQIVKADLLAFARQFDQAIVTLEKLAQFSAIEPGENTQSGFSSYEVHLRLAHLYRLLGNFDRASEALQKCRSIREDDDQVNYLLADIAYNKLDLSKMEMIGVSSDPSGFETPIYHEALTILTVMRLQQVSDLDNARKVLEAANLGSKWHLWKSALDVLSQNRGKLDAKTVETARKELEGLRYKDIEQLIPSLQKGHPSLPNIPAYQIFKNSPSLYLPFALAMAHCAAYDSAFNLLDDLRDAFPYDITPVFHIAQAITLQAEEFRLLNLAKVIRHLPATDSLSLGTFETFEEMILATQRLYDQEWVEDWHQRGIAAFYPTIDNFNTLLDRNSQKNNQYAMVWKLSLDNRIGELNEYLDRVEADVEIRSLSAILNTSKAPTDAFEMLEPVSDFLAVHPQYLAIHAIVAGNVGFNDPAFDTIENALSIWNDEPEWHLLAAHLAMHLNNPTVALHHLRAAVDLEPDNYAYAMEMGTGSAKFGEIPQAIQYFRKAANLDPVNASPWLEMAKAYRQTGDIQQALVSIERSVTLSPDSPEPQVLSAEFSLQAGKPEDAIKKIDSALRIDAKNVQALSLKASALCHLGRTDEAIQLIQNSLKKVANALPLLLTKAEITKEKDGTKGYLKSLHEIATDYPKDTRVLQLYAQSLAENGQSADALRIAQLALKNDPGLADMHILSGRLLRSAGQLDQAIDHFSTCVNLDKTNVDAYLEMARTYQERRDFAKAITIYEKTIETSPKDYRGYYHLGLVLRDSKDYRGAEKNLRKASELAKDDVNILRQLGAIIALNLVHNSQEASVHS